MSAPKLTAMTGNDGCVQWGDHRIVLLLGTAPTKLGDDLESILFTEAL